MKKYIFIMLAVFFCAAVTVPAFAVDFNGPLPGGGPAVTTVIGGASFIPSTNVYFPYLFKRWDRNPSECI